MGQSWHWSDVSSNTKIRGKLRGRHITLPLLERATHGREGKQGGLDRSSNELGGQIAFDARAAASLAGRLRLCTGYFSSGRITRFKEE